MSFRSLFGAKAGRLALREEDGRGYSFQKDRATAATGPSLGLNV
jgi:hypothetical protein